MPITVRLMAPGDEAGWRDLWAQYLAFYEKELPAAVTDATWVKLMDRTAPYWGMIAIDEEAGRAVGFAMNLTHPSTWSIEDVVYLEDLFVSPDLRGKGVGRSLIEASMAESRARGCRAYYWQTHDHNAVARRLYDKITGGATNWVKYEIPL